MANRTGKRAGVKLSVVLLSVFLFLLLFSPVAFAATYGDINDDGVINVQDVVLVMKHVLELEELTATQQVVADVNGDGNINVQDVTLIMQYSLGLIDEFPMAKLEVSKVTAENLKQVEIEFNRALNEQEKSAIVPTNFHIGKQAAPATNVITGGIGDGSAAEILEDGKTVRLTMKNGENFVNYTTTNRVIVRKAVGLDADYVRNDIAISDNAVPTIVSARSEGTRRIAITFSEPLDRTVTALNTIAAFRINDGAIGLSVNAVYNDAKRELTLTTTSDLSGTVTVTIIPNHDRIKGYDSRFVAPGSVSYTHQTVTTAPTVSLKQATATSATLLFNRDVTGVKAETSLFSHGFGHVGNPNEVKGNTANVSEISPREYVVTFANPIPSGDSTIYIYYATGTADSAKIRDFWGNVLSPAQLSVSITTDTVKPFVETVSSPSKNSVLVTFSEPVEAGAGLNGAERIFNYTLRDSDNDIVNITNVAFQASPASTQIVNLTTADLDGGTYTLQVRNVRDRSFPPNTMDTQTITFSVTDRVPPTVDNAYRIDGANKVQIFFSEAMDRTSITTRTNYRYKGSALPAAATITAASNNKSVVLDFTGTAVTVANGDEVVVGRVKDAAGNETVLLSTTLTVQAPEYIGLYRAIATATNRVELTLDTVVSNAVETDYAISINNGADYTAAVSIVSISQSGGRTVIVLEPATLLPSDSVGVKIQTRENGSHGPTKETKDEFGNKIMFDNKVVLDRIPPTLISTNPIKKFDLNGDSRVDHLLIEFSEKLSAGSVSAEKFDIDGYTVVDAYAWSSGTPVFNGRDDAAAGDSQYVLVRVTQKTFNDTGAILSVSISGTIRDVALNSFNAVSNRLSTAATYAPADLPTP